MLLLLCVKRTELLLKKPSETIINVISPFVGACFVFFVFVFGITLQSQNLILFNFLLGAGG